MNTTKLMVKLFLIISLFCATAFAEDGHMGSGNLADGHMSNGGIADDGHMGSGGYTKGDMETGNLDGDMGGGGLTDNQILEFVRGYLFSIFG